MRGVGAVLIVSEDPLVLQRRYLFKTFTWEGTISQPCTSPRSWPIGCWGTAGSSLAELKRSPRAWPGPGGRDRPRGAGFDGGADR